MRRLMVVMTVIGVIAMAGVANASVYNDAVLADSPYLYWTFDEAGDTDNAVKSGQRRPDVRSRVHCRGHAHYVGHDAWRRQFGTRGDFTSSELAVFDPGVRRSDNFDGVGGRVLAHARLRHGAVHHGQFGREPELSLRGQP